MCWGGGHCESGGHCTSGMAGATVQVAWQGPLYKWHGKGHCESGGHCTSGMEAALSSEHTPEQSRRSSGLRGSAGCFDARQRLRCQAGCLVGVHSQSAKPSLYDRMICMIRMIRMTRAEASMPGLPSHTNHTDHTVIRSYESPWAGQCSAGWGRRRRRKKCEDFASFLALSLNAKKKRQRVAAGVFVEFLTPNGLGLILVHPTRRARSWSAQPALGTGSPNDP